MTNNTPKTTSLEASNNLNDYFQKDLQQWVEADSFIDHLLYKTQQTIDKWLRVLILALTKRSSEEITNFMISKWYKTFYLHSEIDTMDRWEIIQKLKTWEIDVLVWVNLLREGIDLPEVWFIGILDADKEWFLRSTTALVQNIWRAARNPNSEVALYADKFTWSILASLRETYRRRWIQQEHNEKNNIEPKQALSNAKNLDIVKSDEPLDQQFSILTKWKVKRLKRMTKKEKAMISADLKEQLDKAIAERRFEDAAILRDQLKEIEEA